MTNTDGRPYPHLNEVAAGLMASSAEARIYAIKEGSWIPYSRATEILTKLEDLLAHPRIIRMPHMLLVGSTNNGKTHILRRFLDQHPPDPNPGGEAASVPVVFVEAPPTPDRGEFYNSILDEVKVPRRLAATIPEREHQVKKVLAKVQTKILIIDEIQHLIAGGLTKQRDFRNAIKNLGNELRISIVASGVEDAFNAFSTDPQLSNRFVPEALPLWRLDKEFARLLATLERRTPLGQPSNLVDGAMMIQLHSMSEGLIGEVHQIIKEAAVLAIRTKKEKIDLVLLDQIGWVRPSKRRDRREFGL